MKGLNKMKITQFLKKYIFVFLLFCVQELFMNLIGEYNKTFLAKSITGGKYIIDMLWTLVLYSVVVFTIAFIIFLMFFKEQSLLYSFKKKLLGFVGVTAAYEIVKLIAYLIAKDKTQSVYFILGNTYLFAVQIVIFRLFSEIDTQNNEKHLNIGKKHMIASAVLIIAAAVFVIISENSVRNSSSELYKSSFAFACGFRLAFVTALIQTVLFGGILNDNISENATFKIQFILFFAISFLAFVLWLVKFAFPEGMMSGWHGTDDLEKPAKSCFSKNSFQTEYKRIIDRKEKSVYFTNTIEIYYDNEQVLSYSYNDPSKPGKIEYFELKSEDIKGLVEEDTAIVYRTYEGKIEYCVLDGKQSSGYDKSVYERALRSI